MQISRQSADSQQASTMPQSVLHESAQSGHPPMEQHEQHIPAESGEHEPHVRRSRRILHRERN